MWPASPKSPWKVSRRHYSYYISNIFSSSPYRGNAQDSSAGVVRSNFPEIFSINNFIYHSLNHRYSLTFLQEPTRMRWSKPAWPWPSCRPPSPSTPWSWTDSSTLTWTESTFRMVLPHRLTPRLFYLNYRIRFSYFFIGQTLIDFNFLL